MKESKKKKSDKPEYTEPVVYTPVDAELNYSNTLSAPPKTEYEKTRATFKRKQVRDLTKGKYGHTNNN